MAAQAAEEGWTLDRAEHIEKWREQGWPGPLTPENAQLLHVARVWWAYDDLSLAQKVTGLEIPATGAEGLLMRLGMAYRHFRDQAREEARRDG